MIQGKGVKLDGKVVEDITLIVKMTEPSIIQFGKNKFVKVK